MFDISLLKSVYSARWKLNLYLFFFTLIVCYNSFTFGLPNPSTVVEDLESIDTANNDGGLSRNLTRVARAENHSNCVTSGGCWKGYCWAHCLAIGNLVVANEWCYTTKSYSQSYEYVTCSSDSECDLCWNCAGSCTV